jgi:flagellin
MRINTNVSSLTAQEAAQNTSKRITSSLEKLSTGLRINKASDDASGLAIADKLRTQATSINQGISNGNSAVSLLQIADKSMAEQSNILDTIKSKLIQANTDTTSADGRESIRKDIAKLLEQLDNIAEQTNYNGNVLLQKSSTSTDTSTSLSFQVGETSRDIITNTSIQSNTNGLGSKVSYGKDITLEGNGGSKFIASTSEITIKGTDSAGSGIAEKITLDGDVDSLTLAVGTKVSAVDDATKVKLDALKASGKATLSSGTYTITTASTLDLKDIDTVKATLVTATPSTASNNAPTNIQITQGQVVSAATMTTGSKLETALNDTNLFTKLASGMYVAIKPSAVTIEKLESGESFKLNDTVEAKGGNANATGISFTPGDEIKVNNIVSGSLLDKSLNDTSMFTKKSTGVYVVKADFTAGKLYLMGSEKISITDGTSVSLAKAATGLNETALKYHSGGTTGAGSSIFRDGSSGTNLKTTSITGGQLYAAGEDTISFTITAGTGTTGSSNAKDFTIKAGDIVKLVKDAGNADTTGNGNALSVSLMEGSGFIALGSGKYQAKTDTTLKMDVGDKIDVTRLVGGVSTPTEITGSAAGEDNTSSMVNDTVSLYKNTTGSGTADTQIKLDIGKGATITNNDTSATNKLNITSAADITNGKDNLSALRALTEGQLTVDNASGFQSVIDDSITKLNGYRGDIGSTQNQVESAVRNLMTQATNVKAAESIIRDVDYAAESANFNKQNIISQAGSYAISQANTVQQNVLKLLQ